MRKNNLIILLVALSFLFASVASAEMYVTGKIGYVMTSDSDLGVLGYDFATIE